MKMEFDLYIEDLKLAVEYQGQHHYKPFYWARTGLETQELRDDEKRIACQQVN